MFRNYNYYTYNNERLQEEDAYDGDSERKTGDSIGDYAITDTTTTVEVNKLHYDYEISDVNGDSALTHYRVLLSQNVRANARGVKADNFEQLHYW